MEVTVSSKTWMLCFRPVLAHANCLDAFALRISIQYLQPQSCLSMPQRALCSFAQITLLFSTAITGAP